MKIVKKLFKIAAIILVIYIIGKIGYSDMQDEIMDSNLSNKIMRGELIE